MGLSRHHSTDTSHSTGVLCGMGSNLSNMGRGELCHDRLTDRMQDIGRQQTEHGKSNAQASYVSPGFSDCKVEIL